MHETEDVFVSYSRQDNDRVLELTGQLRAAGVRLWMDVRNIDGAAMWGEEIVNAVAKSKVLLLLVSKTAVASQNVLKEVLLASERKGHILPVHLEPTEIPGSLKYALAGIQHIEFFRGDPDAQLKAVSALARAPGSRSRGRACDAALLRFGCRAASADRCGTVRHRR